MSLGSIAGSTEFAAALGGAGAAFLLEALRRWWADNSKKQASINLALLSLSQMYTVLKNYHDQVFINTRAAMTESLGREPLAFEFRPAIGLSDQNLAIKYEDLGVLLQSYDPDVLSRLLAAERIYLGDRSLMHEHTDLHHEFQHRTASHVDTPEQVTVGTIRAMVGVDLFQQLTDVATGLRDHLPTHYADIATVGKQLRKVARMQFPVRRFVAFELIAPTAIVAAPERRMPSWWRRAIRWKVDLLRDSKRRNTLILWALVVALGVLMSVEVWTLMQAGLPNG